MILSEAAPPFLSDYKKVPNATNSFVVRSPGRVNLIGEHTDYNGGLVLPMAIEPHISISVVRRTDRKMVLRSERSDSVTLEHDLEQMLTPSSMTGSWTAYLCGVIAGYQELDWDIPGFEVDVSSTLPVGGGLSSSAALEVGMATAVEALCRRSLPLQEKALLCQKAEHDFAGVPCGIMDQFAVTFGQTGHLLSLDCRSHEMIHVPLQAEAISVLIINSGIKHSLADGEYAKRRMECESAAALLNVTTLREVSLDYWHEKHHSLPELELKRSRHVITEHVRTLEFIEALKAEDWQRAGEQMYGSHASLRDDYGVSCRELDLLVDFAKDIPGVHGCRMTGGGFGGCAVALIETHLMQEIQEQFRKRYLQATAIDPVMLVTRPTCGARVID